MKLLIVISVLSLVSASLTLAIRNRTARTAEACNVNVCPGNTCQCSYTYSPIAVEDTPQVTTR